MPLNQKYKTQPEQSHEIRPQNGIRMHQQPRVHGHYIRLLSKQDNIRHHQIESCEIRI